MTRNRKIFVTTMWAIAVLSMMGFVSAGLWQRRENIAIEMNSPSRGNILFDAPSFSLIDQNGETISDEKLRGNVWIASLFFSSCPGVCPMMTARLRELQQAVPDADVKIVSISIDPQHDTPEVLEKYADKLGADQSRWYFLTGPQNSGFELARKFKLAAEPATGDQPISHTSKVLLINQKNQVCGIYNATDSDSVKKLAVDAHALAAGKTP